MELLLNFTRLWSLDLLSHVLCNWTSFCGCPSDGSLYCRLLAFNPLETCVNLLASRSNRFHDLVCIQVTSFGTMGRFVRESGYFAGRERLGNFSRKCDIVMGHCRKNAKVVIFARLSPEKKNRHLSAGLTAMPDSCAFNWKFIKVKDGNLSWGSPTRKTTSAILKDRQLSSWWGIKGQLNNQN